MKGTEIHAIRKPVHSAYIKNILTFFTRCEIFENKISVKRITRNNWSTRCKIVVEITIIAI